MQKIQVESLLLHGRYNWTTLNQRVFKRHLGFVLARSELEAVSSSEARPYYFLPTQPEPIPLAGLLQVHVLSLCELEYETSRQVGAIERILKLLRIKLKAYKERQAQERQLAALDAQGQAAEVMWDRSSRVPE